MNETLFCSEPRLVPSFEERYSAESADWKKRGSSGCIGQGSKKAGWLGLSRAVKNDIILEAERRLYILLFTKARMIYYLHSWRKMRGLGRPLNGQQGGHRYARSSYR